MGTGYFPPGLVSDNSVGKLNIIVVEQSPETNNAPPSNTKAHQFPVIWSLKRMLADYFLPGTLGEEGVAMPGPVLIDPVVVVEKLPISNVYRFPVLAAKRSIESLRRLWIDNLSPATSEDEGAMMPGSVLADPMVQVEELPAETNNQIPLITNVYRYPVIAASRLVASLKRMWIDYFRAGALDEEGVTMPGSTFKFVILGLISLAAIKSQGETKFPFQSHPRIITVAITSFVVYGLASAAEYVISAARTGPNSVYAFIAKLGKKLCLCALVASLASLFYF